MTNSQTNCKTHHHHHPPRVASTSGFSSLPFFRLVLGAASPPPSEAASESWRPNMGESSWSPRRAKGFVLPKGWKGSQKLHESAEKTQQCIYTFTGLKRPWIICDDICLLTENHYGTLATKIVANPPPSCGTQWREYIYVEGTTFPDNLFSPDLCINPPVYLRILHSWRIYQFV